LSELYIFPNIIVPSYNGIEFCDSLSTLSLFNVNTSLATLKHQKLANLYVSGNFDISMIRCMNLNINLYEIVQLESTLTSNIFYANFITIENPPSDDPDKPYDPNNDMCFLGKYFKGSSQKKSLELLVRLRNKLRKDIRSVMIVFKIHNFIVSLDDLLKHIART
jgi:hypothetical protein